MNDEMPSLSALKARGLPFHLAVHKLYEAIKTTKHLVGERRRPTAILRQLEALEAGLDRVYNEASEQELTLYDVARMAHAVRRSYDELVNDTETAYESGWQAALNHVLDNAPDDSAVVVRWLIKTLESDAAWRTPEWDGVIELIREARRQLAANSGERGFAIVAYAGQSRTQPSQAGVFGNRGGFLWQLDEGGTTHGSSPTRSGRV